MSLRFLSASGASTRSAPSCSALRQCTTNWGFPEAGAYPVSRLSSAYFQADSRARSPSPSFLPFHVLSSSIHLLEMLRTGNNFALLIARRTANKVIYKSGRTLADVPLVQSLLSLSTPLSSRATPPSPSFPHPLSSYTFSRRSTAFCSCSRSPKREHKQMNGKQSPTYASNPKASPILYAGVYGSLRWCLCQKRTEQ